LGTGSVGWDKSLETIGIQGSQLILDRMTETLAQKKLQRIFPLDGTSASMSNCTEIMLLVRLEYRCDLSEVGVMWARGQKATDGVDSEKGTPAFTGQDEGARWRLA